MKINGREYVEIPQAGEDWAAVNASADEAPSASDGEAVEQAAPAVDKPKRTFPLRAGIDVGSTTVKLAILDEDD